MTDTKALLDFISGPESNGNYNAYYGNTNNQSVRFTDMTIAQVQDFQAQLARDTGSSAVGRYQFLQKTLGGLVTEMGIPTSARFTPELQDQLGQKLLERRGLTAFTSGAMSAEEFANNLAQEWAGLPMVSGPKAGRSYYDGDAIGNKSGVSPDAFLAVLGGSGSGLPTRPSPGVTSFDNAPDLTLSQKDQRQFGPEPAPFQVGSPESAAMLAETQPTTPWTNADMRAFQAAEAERKAQAPNLFELGGMAIQQEWVIPNLFREKPDAAPDPTFEMTPEFMKELTQDIPEEYWDRFVETHSTQHGLQIRESLLQSMETDQKLADAGAWGVGLRIAAGMTDPVAWAAGAGITVATGGVGGAAFIGAKLGRAGMIAHGAATGMASTAIPEALIAANKPTYHQDEFLQAIGMGMVLGGAFGALARNPATRVEAREIETVGRNLERIASGKGSDAGAASAGVREALGQDTDELVRDLTEEATGTSFANKARWDLSARLKGSSNKLVRAFGNVLVEDGTRNAKGMTKFSVSEEGTKLARQAEVRWRAAFDTSFKAYAKRTGVKRQNFDRARDDFARQVTSFVRSRSPLDDAPAEVAAAAGEFRSLMKHWRALASNPGMLDGTTRRAVRGFEKLADSEFYAPRIFDLGAVQNALAKYGHDALGRMVGKAMMEVNEDLGEDVAMRFGRGYIDKLHSISAGELNVHARALSGDDMEALKALLFDATDLSSDELDDILLGIKKADKGTPGAPSRGKRRLFMDENFAAKLARLDSTGEDEFRISDLFSNNADELMTMYSRQMSGRIAMARMRIERPNWQEGDEASRYIVDGITSDSEWEQWMTKVREVGDRQGVNSENKIDVERLTFAYNHIVGRPTFDEATGYAQTLRLLRNFNFTRLMGQVGLAQIPEFANVVSKLGIKATFSNMPAWRAMWRNAQTGKLDDTLAQEWEDITGLGADWLRHTSWRAEDDYGNPLMGLPNNRWFDKADRALMKSNKAVTAISGMAPVNTALQRLTGRAIFNKFASIALKGDVTADRRMMGLGLDTEMLQRISGQIKGKASFEGSRLKAMNFKSWDDQEALAHFENAVFRYAREVIQENDIGNLAMWMNKPTAKTLLQFRTFVLAAWSKQFLNGLNHRDFQTFASFTTSMFLGSMTYMFREYANSVGRSDQEEHLKERLSVERIAAAGLQNSSWFSILAPVLDTPINWATGESLFDARTTQQSNTVTDLGSNPTGGLLDLVVNGPSILRKALQGDLAQGDLRKVKMALPYQNLMGISQLFNLMLGGLPERRR